MEPALTIGYSIAHSQHNARNSSYPAWTRTLSASASLIASF